MVAEERVEAAESGVVPITTAANLFDGTVFLKKADYCSLSHDLGHFQRSISRPILGVDVSALGD